MSEQLPVRRVSFGDYSFAMPDHELEYVLRTGKPTREQLLQAASILASYTSLTLFKTCKDRNMISKKIKQEYLCSKSKVLYVKGCSG